MDELAFKPAVELVADIKAKTIGSRELTEHYVRRIEEHDREINAVVVRNFEQALESADAADRAAASGVDLGPLHGLPMTIKEAYDIEGLPTTWGIPLLAKNIATSDSHSVRHLKNAGAHFLGKTNVPLHLADFQSYNDIYGQTGNPWDLSRTPGGSSGGSSAALAAGLTGLEAGSDIGGSIRNPAHFCGVYGHKPTWGVVPSAGHSLPGDHKPPDIAVCGPLARSAEDLAVSMDIVAGADSFNEAGWQLNLPRPERHHLQDYRVAVLPSHDLAPVDAEIADRVDHLAGVLARAGASVSEAALPDIDFEESMAVYVSLLQGVMAETIPVEARAQIRERLAGIHDQGMEAQMLRGAVQDHATWMASHNKRFILRERWGAFFDDWDILLCPQTATVAFPHDHSSSADGSVALDRTIMVNGAEQPYFQQLFWAGTITVAHLPSTVFPTGLSKSGLPIGIQAVGAEFNDYTCIEFARLMAQEIGGFVPPPAYQSWPHFLTPHE
ncbi:MAG: amidase [Actinomycetia bacterium]|nr:amidase [Actinomycetes bacterium]